MTFYKIIRVLVKIFSGRENYEEQAHVKGDQREVGAKYNGDLELDPRPETGPEKRHEWGIWRSLNETYRFNNIIVIIMDFLILIIALWFCVGNVLVLGEYQRE